jgi:hypothetical protein
VKLGKRRNVIVFVLLGDFFFLFLSVCLNGPVKGDERWAKNSENTRIWPMAGMGQEWGQWQESAFGGDNNWHDR